VDIAREFIKEPARLSQSLNIKRFLNGVGDASNALSALQNYDFAYKYMAETSLQRGTCSAILVGSADRTHDFVGAVTRNPGYNVRIFHDEEAAIVLPMMMNVGPSSAQRNSWNWRSLEALCCEYRA
jgi:hypothetical protein